MPQYAAVSRERHANKKWLRYTNLAFAAGETIAPIVGTNWRRRRSLCHVPSCSSLGAMSWWRCFRSPVAATCSWRRMVDGSAGIFLRCFGSTRFDVPNKGTDAMVLCVDEESKLVVDGNSAGEEFFDAQGNPAPVLKPVFEVGMALERERKSTDLAVEALAEAWCHPTLGNQSHDQRRRTTNQRAAPRR